MKFRPRKNFNCLNNIYCSLYDVEKFLNCICKTKKAKKIYTLFKQWKWNYFKRSTDGRPIKIYACSGALTGHVHMLHIQYIHLHWYNILNLVHVYMKLDKLLRMPHIRYMHLIFCMPFGFTSCFDFFIISQMLIEINIYHLNCRITTGSSPRNFMDSTDISSFSSETGEDGAVIATLSPYFNGVGQIIINLQKTKKDGRHIHLFL